MSETVDTPRLRKMHRNLVTINQQLDSLAAPREFVELTDTAVVGEERSKSDHETIRLKAQLNAMRTKMDRLVTENEMLRTENRQLKEVKAQLNVCKKQISELKTFISKGDRLVENEQTPAHKRLRLAAGMEAAPSPLVQQRLRNETLNARLKEVEAENLEYKRCLAGLTPKDVQRVKSRSCHGCKQLNIQKTRQAQYFEEKLIKSREQASLFKDQSERLRLELIQFRSKLIQLEERYQVHIDKISERTAMYKGRSERQERLRINQTKGFYTDIKQLKVQLNSVEKTLIETQMLKFLSTNFVL